MKPRADRIESMRQWLLGRHPSLDSLAIDASTDIIETRTLDSLDLVEFILFLEKESGRPILVETLDADQLRTLDRIYEAFFEEHP